MKVKSKIKSIFDQQLRHQIAAICDTRQIQNNILKMDLSQRLMTTRGIKTEQLGGATNRYVVMIDGYAVKIAVDRQGFKDNLMEYALTNELQPYMTKSFETNGYILIQKCVRIVTLEEWRLRKVEILKILDEIGREYLLGDVGYDDVNRTNWGVTDEGDLVILDYAYCHRLTEDLFTCPVCGSVLSYDQNFTMFLCTDRANCHARYSYNQIKARQGDAVDWETIAEKKNRSIVIPNNKDSIEVDRSDDLLLDESTFVIRSYSDMARYKEVKDMLTLDYNDPDVMYLVTKLTMAKARPVPDTGKIAELEGELNKLRKDIPNVKCIVDPEFKERLIGDGGYIPPGWDEQIDIKTNEEEDLSRSPFEEMMAKLREARANKNVSQQVWDDEPENEIQMPDESVAVQSETANNDNDDVSPYTAFLREIRSAKQSNQKQENLVYGGDGEMLDPIVSGDWVDSNDTVSQSVEFPDEVIGVVEESGQPVAITEENESVVLTSAAEVAYTSSTATVCDENAQVDAEDNDDATGEPESELESAVEEEYPPAPIADESGNLEEGEFTSEPVNEDGDDGESFPISVGINGDEEAVDPENVFIDDARLTNNTDEEANAGE